MFLEVLLSLVVASVVFFFLIFFFLSERHPRSSRSSAIKWKKGRSGINDDDAGNATPIIDESSLSASTTKKQQENAAGAIASQHQPETEEDSDDAKKAGKRDDPSLAASLSLLPWFLSPAVVRSVETTPASDFSWIESLLSFVFAAHMSRCSSTAPSSSSSFSFSSGSLDAITSDFFGDTIAAALERAVANEPMIQSLELVDATLPFARSHTIHRHHHHHQHHRPHPAAASFAASTSAADRLSASTRERSEADAATSTIGDDLASSSAAAAAARPECCQLLPIVVGDVRSQFRVVAQPQEQSSGEDKNKNSPRARAFDGDAADQDDDDAIVAETVICARIKFDVQCALELQGEIFPLMALNQVAAKRHSATASDADATRAASRKRDDSTDDKNADDEDDDLHSRFVEFDSIGEHFVSGRSPAQNNNGIAQESHIGIATSESGADERQHRQHLLIHHLEKQQQQKLQVLKSALPLQLLSMQFALRVTRMSCCTPVRIVLKCRGKSGSVTAHVSLSSGDDDNDDDQHNDNDAMVHSRAQRQHCHETEMDLEFAALLGDPSQLQIALRSQVKRALLDAMTFMVNSRVAAKKELCCVKLV